VPGAGLLQAGAFTDQLMPVAVSPLLQVKAGRVIATPETPLAGTVPQASVTGAELDELVVAEEEDDPAANDEDDEAISDDDEDCDDDCRRVIFCTGMFPLPVSGISA
jgi:hypothetical protein